MKFGQIARGILILSVCSITVLTSCGKGSQGGESDTEQLMAYKDTRYLPQFTDTSENYHALASQGLGYADGTFYLLKRNYTETGYGYNLGGGQVLACDPDTGEENLLLDQEELGRKIVAAAPSKDGSVIVVTGDRETGYGLYKMDADGKELFSREISLYEEPLNYLFTVDTQGRSYFLTGNEILLFDAQGAAAGKIDVSGKIVRNMVCRKDGTVYLYELMTNQLIPLDFDSARMGEGTYSVPVALRAIAAGSTADFLICDNTTFYQYNCGEGEITPLFDLQDSQIPFAYNIDTIGEMGDGRIFLFTKDTGEKTTEIACLTPTPLAECPAKEIVTIAAINPGDSLLESVVNFNRQSKDFTISVVNYRIGGRSYADAQSALRLDLSIGQGPDLCALDELTDPETLFAGGCFTDLSSYLEDSRQYGREDFMPQALEAYTWQGELLAIPKYFRLETVVGRADVVGTDMGWSMEDMKAIIRSHPDAVLFDNCSNFYVFDLCIRNMLEDFVDLDRKKADFESEGYIEFLNFIKELPDSGSIDGTLNDSDSWLLEGKALFSRRDIAQFTDFQHLEVYFGGDYTCIGYPSSDRTPDCAIGTFGAYGITAASEQKDLAWRFIEWAHSAQGEEDILTRGGFPTRVDVFERELREATGEESGKKRPYTGFLWNGIDVDYRDMTSEEVELLYSLIESASPNRNTEQTIVEIMKEEAAYLYDGRKTAEEVAEVTQNRVQLYLNE